MIIPGQLAHHSGDGVPCCPPVMGGTAEAVARAICWLLSDEASSVTGAILDVTGGR